MARGDDPLEEQTPAGGRLSAGMVIGIVLGGALTLFVAQNTDEVSVQWLTFEARQPLWLVLLATAAVTLVVAELVGGARRRRRKKKGS